MTKEEITKSIFDNSKIHHNIHINYVKAQKAVASLSSEEAEGFNQDMQIENYMIDDFISNFETLEMNDLGNRNLCSCKKFIFKKEDFISPSYKNRAYSDEAGKWYSYKEAKKAGLIDKWSRKFMVMNDGMHACKQHDLYHIYTHGRGGATLYWDKYWKSSNSGFYFKYEEYELEEMERYELETMLKEIKTFNVMVNDLMTAYYKELEYQAGEYKQQKKEEIKQNKYAEMVKPYEVNLFELSKDKNEAVSRNAKSLIKQLKIK